jgi:hypothetical protein
LVKGLAKPTTPELSWLATALLFPPWEEYPQVTTEPSAFRAAQAPSVQKIWLTPELSRLATALLLPPESESPQVTTEPSAFSAAKAPPFEKTWLTPELS